MSVLQIRDLTKQYGSLTAVKKLSLSVEKGNIYGILGPNGSGKTTTLGIILGIINKNGGDYEWFEGRYGQNARQHIGALLETPNFYPYLTAQKIWRLLLISSRSIILELTSFLILSTSVIAKTPCFGPFLLG